MSKEVKRTSCWQISNLNDKGQDMNYSFLLQPDELKQVQEWVKTLPPEPRTAIGGRFTYSFTPTSIGVVVKVIDNISLKEIDVTDYNSW